METEENTLALWPNFIIQSAYYTFDIIEYPYFFCFENDDCYYFFFKVTKD